MEDKEKRSRTTSDRLNMTERPGTKKSVRRTSVDGERTAKTRVSKEYTAGESTQRTRAARPASASDSYGRTRTTKKSVARGTTESSGKERPVRSQAERLVRSQAERTSRDTAESAVRDDVTRTRSSKSQAARKPARSRKQSKKRRQRSLMLKTAFTVILLIVAVAGIFLWKKYSPSKEIADKKEYYGIEQEGQLGITVNNQVVEPQGMIADGKAYVQYEIVRDYINSRFYWDPNENILLYTLPNDTVSVSVGSKDYSISKEKKSEDYVILKTEGSTAYIALDFIRQYTDMEYEVFDDPQRVVINSDWSDKTVATVKKDSEVRYRGGIKSPILTEVSKKDEVVVLEEEENWRKVCTADGYVGYIKKSALKKVETKTYERDFEEPVYTNITKDYVINMAWHNVTNTTANDSVLQRIAESKGLTTIAPTWYHVANTSGDLSSISSSDYVNYAHQSNIEVWATVRDFDGGISSYEESYELLSKTSNRENLINHLVADALKTGIDGINVDFEKISDECGEHYIQFIRELSVRCRQNGIVLSVDNYVPKGYNMQYNREEQGIVADYVIIMGYDEHFAGSPEAGPVSSYDFVKEGIEETLKEVPAEKIISGIPFFTRLWAETPKTAEELAAAEGTEQEEYTMKVTSDALGMSAAVAAVEEAGAEITWDEAAQQDFATWTFEDITYKIWLENEKSIEPKLQLMKENNLAGTAAWALGQESKETWELILKYVN